MKIKNKTIFGALIISQILICSCTGFSKTGRDTIIARAQEEAKKEESTPIPNTIIKNIEPIIEDIQDIVTPSEAKGIKDNLIKNKIGPAQGKLIQVEGLVLKEVRELTIKLNTTSSQLEQIVKMKEHVRKNWHYIYDPATDNDTWRSAEATISLKFQGKYPGDCDDYSILLASFARQIGLTSRVAAGFDGKDGHAFAEFKIQQNDIKSPYLRGFDYRKSNGYIWVSLDWFRGDEHNRFTNNAKILYGI
ncbi:transglutaminase-like domain-containing protein [Tenacibaculum maritimum]|uniref:transglutaminase-like domain-containing protein n=1 Tax=Tenacibaculum maritimum TaxID=107401 RepID=UPI00388E97E8